MNLIFREKSMPIHRISACPLVKMVSKGVDKPRTDDGVRIQLRSCECVQDSSRE